jgi:hypothetical protein
MRPTPTNTGLPHLDVASWEKGFADGFRGRVWWPGPGAERAKANTAVPPRTRRI